MNRADTLRWLEVGSRAFADVLARIEDDDLSAPSLLPGWDRRHLIAHVAANADALVRLASWAATGVETPMYSSKEARADEIEAGSQLPAAALRRWFTTSRQRLSQELLMLSQDAWSSKVRTAQGRVVAASEIPWMRAREVMVHAVDLNADFDFEGLPEDFLDALITDACAKRSANPEHPSVRAIDEKTARTYVVHGDQPAISVTAPIAVLAEWLTGRGTPAKGRPTLPPWL